MVILVTGQPGFADTADKFALTSRSCCVLLSPIFCSISLASLVGAILTLEPFLCPGVLRRRFNVQHDRFCSVRRAAFQPAGTGALALAVTVGGDAAAGVPAAASEKSAC